MLLTILGNNGPYPQGSGACSGYLISDDESKCHVLIDCGTGVLANLRGTLPVEALDAVILSHLHYDHMSDMLPMQYALQFAHRADPLPVYLPDSPENVRALLEVSCYDLRGIQSFNIGNLHFSFEKMRHPVETYAVRVTDGRRTLVFTGDTNETPALEPFAQSCNLLLADAGLCENDWHDNAPHLSARRCAQHAAALGCELLLTHFNPIYAPDALLREAKEVMPNARVAAIGETYRI